jgi:hypothetical protein
MPNPGGCPLADVGHPLSMLRRSATPDDQGTFQESTFARDSLRATVPVHTARRHVPLPPARPAAGRSPTSITRPTVGSRAGGSVGSQQDALAGPRGPTAAVNHSDTAHDLSRFLGGTEASIPNEVRIRRRGTGSGAPTAQTGTIQSCSRPRAGSRRRCGRHQWRRDRPEHPEGGAESRGRGRKSSIENESTAG